MSVSGPWDSGALGDRSTTTPGVPAAVTSRPSEAIGDGDGVGAEDAPTSSGTASPAATVTSTGSPTVDADPASAPSARRRLGRRRASDGKRHWLPTSVRRIVQLLVLALVVEYLVLPQISGTRKNWHTLTQVNPIWILVGVVLEALSLTAYFQLTRTMLPAESDPGLPAIARVQLSTLAVSHCVPGGSAAGSSLGYRLLNQAGVRPSDTGFALASQGLGSAVVLNIILWVSLVVSIPFYGFQPTYLAAALVGVVLMSVMGGTFFLFTKGDQRALAAVRAIGRRMPFLDEETLPRLFRQLAERVAELSRDRRRLALALAYASANWLFDAASLLVFIGAFGYWFNPVELLVAYGLAFVLAAIPVTPGGLGVVEGVLTPTLVGFGSTKAVVVLGVIGYRLVNFWLPIPVGGLAYLSLQVLPLPESMAARLNRRKLWRVRLRRAVEMLEGGDTRSSGS